MDANLIFGDNTSYYSKKSDPEDIVRLLNYGVQHIGVGILFLDSNRKCVYANKHAFSMFHSEEDPEVIGNLFYEWMNGLGIAQTAASWCRVYSNGDKERLYRVRFRSIIDTDGILIGYMYTIQNLSDLVENSTGEQYRLTHDELTGLYNREGFNEGARELLKKANKPYLLLYSNIKDFKLFNQLFGIDKGNDILLNIGDMILQHVREDDIYGRINGDHFAMCIPKDRFDERGFKKLVREIANRVTSKTYSLHMQVGVYEVRDPYMDIALMCDRAYMACKSIKKDGVCEIAWYSDEMLVNALLEKEVLSSFDFAIINKQFGIYLQPQVHSDGTVFGAEALARWLHPENGVIQPAVFIDVLERADLIYKLDRYIWELAAAQLAAWKGTDMEGLSVSVNVSPKDLYYLDIKREFTDLVNQYNIDPHLLNIEITETAVTSDVSKCSKLILDLQSSGFVVEIDDFGSGYSSLNMLKDINADVLKIDMGFLRKTDNLQRAQVILNYTIDMAHELGMGVITEGVETKEQLDFLMGMGCKMFQGFYYDMPMPVESFEDKYRGKLSKQVTEEKDHEF
ncbi:EAL domain-containing protein [Butyrivibrio sp. CB08]|uniref:EAL domain-containing protein n=1 Tax=Butyrivibrio sp. CB08 TaxID=2364879 RepID=UPI00131455A7|nr:EAL domain-containing protein [Butyrivibrio sp. CB08]